jgi:hypothetical protein
VAVFLVTGLAAILDSRTRTIEAASESVLLVNEKDVY